MAESVRYEVDGWGVGELWLDGAMLLWHELPRPRGSDIGVHLHHSLAERIAAHFAGARVRPSGRAVGSLSFRREVAHASRRGLAAPRRVELRGRAAGVQPAAVVQRRLRDPALPAARLRPRD